MSFTPESSSLDYEKLYLKDKYQLSNHTPVSVCI